MLSSWLSSFLLTFVCFAENASAFASPRDSERVNFLIIVTDDQRWDEMGVVQREQGSAARFAFLQTPRLDALAAQGMRFRNAFVTTSLCSPSRSAILTGQYNHTNGMINNLTPFSPKPTWATALQALGYSTAYVGKFHHGPQWERPGFDYVATFKGQGNYFGTTFRVNGKPVATKGYVDGHSVDFATQFLEKLKNEPFAMMVGFKAVHQTVTPMPAHSNDYANIDIGLPQSWHAPAPWLGVTVPHRRRGPSKNTHWRSNVRQQTINGIDENVGRLLDALKANGLEDKTVVMFLSDNGYYLGEHLLGDKRSAYEESIRVPLIIKYPGAIAPGSVSDAMALNIDLGPTILDIVASAVPDTMQGRSLAPLWEQENPSWRDAFLYEYWQDEHWAKHKRKRTPTIVAVRTDTHKLVTYPDYPKWTELFDLRSDPYEVENLANYSQYAELRHQMCDRLVQIMQETNFNPRTTINNWLIGIIDSVATYRSHTRYPMEDRPLPQRNHPC